MPEAVINVPSTGPIRLTHRLGLAAPAKRLMLAGGLIILMLVLLAVAAPVLTHLQILREPDKLNLKGLDQDGMPLPPGSAFLLGSDNLGRDVLSRAMHGAGVSLTVGVVAMLIATVIGVAVGILAGFFGGKLDLFLMRITEIVMTIPTILLAIAFASLIGDQGRVIHLHPAALPWHFLDFTLKRGVTSVIAVIGLVCWPGMVRVIRGQVMQVKEREFIQAARSLGASRRRLIWRHILPNILPTVIVLAAMTTANTILLEAGLGYLGIGVPAPAPTWGSMIADGQPYFASAPYLVVVPGVAIVLTVLGFNLMGQGLQEWLNPKQRQ
jgi:peptide/nickel transport system permease protein